MTPQELYNNATKVRRDMMLSHLVKVVRHPNIHGNCLISLAVVGSIDRYTILPTSWYKSN